MSQCHHRLLWCECISQRAGRQHTKHPQHEETCCSHSTTLECWFSCGKELFGRLAPLLVVLVAVLCCAVLCCAVLCCAVLFLCRPDPLGDAQLPIWRQLKCCGCCSGAQAPYWEHMATGRYVHLRVASRCCVNGTVGTTSVIQCEQVVVPCIAGWPGGKAPGWLKCY